MGNNMKYYIAEAIFNDIDSEKFDDKEKAMAIYIVSQRPQHMGRVKKEAMFHVIQWLWNRCFKVKKAAKEASRL